MSQSRDRLAREPLVMLGAIVGVHGVRGAVKLKSFTADPGAVACYGPLTDETGARSFSIKLLGHAPGGLLRASVEGITDRNAAEALKGVRLCIPRSRLPEPKQQGEYYQADLIGLEVFDEEGNRLGKVIGVRNFGGGDLLDVEDEQGNGDFIPFSDAAVPVVDLAAGRVVINRLNAFGDGEAMPEQPDQPE